MSLCSQKSVGEVNPISATIETNDEGNVSGIDLGLQDFESLEENYLG